jgi:hypothetical protein
LPIINNIINITNDSTNIINNDDDNIIDNDDEIIIDNNDNINIFNNWLNMNYEITNNNNDRINSKDLYEVYQNENSYISVVKFSKYMKNNKIQFIKPKNKTVYIKIKRKN